MLMKLSRLLVLHINGNFRGDEMKVVNILIVLCLIISSAVYSAEKDELSKFSFINYCSNTAQQDVNTPAGEKKSVTRALLLSLAVPSLGERYAGQSKLSKYLIASEVAWWGLYIWHNVYSGWMEDDYITFAAAHAGIESAGKNKKYYVNIGNFTDIYGYNEKKMLDRDDDLVYKNVSEDYWRWNSDDNKEKFKEMRVKSDRYSNRVNYFATGIILNHIISGINAAIIAKKWNISLESQSAWKLEYISSLPYSTERIDAGARLSFRF